MKREDSTTESGAEELRSVLAVVFAWRSMRKSEGARQSMHAVPSTAEATASRGFFPSLFKKAEEEKEDCFVGESRAIKMMTGLAQPFALSPHRLSSFFSPFALVFPSFSCSFSCSSALHTAQSTAFV